MCCLLYLGEYTQIPHLDKVPNFPSLEPLDILPAVKAVTHFHPNLPLFDWHLCADGANVATFLRQAVVRVQCPALPQLQHVASEKQKTSQASFSLQDCEIYWEARRKRNRTLILRRFHGVGACCSIRPVGKMKTTLQISDNAIV